MKLLHKAEQFLRSQKGFSLATIVVLGIAASLVMFGTARILTVSNARVTRERLTDTLRASAEAGLDWAVSALSDPAQRSTVDATLNNETSAYRATTTSIPDDCLQDSSFTGTVTVENLSPPKQSYLYSSLLDPLVAGNNIIGGNGWRVVTATVGNGIKSKSVRVMLKPNYATMMNTVVTTITGTQITTSTSITQVQGASRPLFTKSLFSKGTMDFSGNGANTDSYDSSTNPNPSVFNTGSAGSGDIASNSSINVGNANINGSVLTTSGSTATGSVSVSSNGMVTNGISASGAINNGGTVTGNTVERTAAVQQSLPDAPTAPTGSTNLGSISLNGGQRYSFPSAGNYIVNSLSVGGSATLVTPSSGIVNIYVQGAGANISIGGGGINNQTAIPSNVRIWYSGTQTVSVGGNGAIRAVLYAPNAPVQINGNGQIYGSIIGNSVSITGGAAFHYDTALGVSTQLTYIPLVTTTITTTSVTTVISSTTLVTTSNAISNFQAVSWMEF